MPSCSLYIHIPFCVSKCAYCDFFSIPCAKRQVPDAYIDALCREIAFRAQKYTVRRWNTVYIGGGTPSLLSAEQLMRIMTTAKTAVPHTAEIPEVTIEANPDDITGAFLEGAKNAGITRLSCGVQALEPGPLASVKRRGSIQTVRTALTLIADQWHGAFSADMLCALPGQTEASFLAGLDELLRYHPNHISLYSLIIEEGTPLGKAVRSGTLPYDDDTADALWIKGRDFLIEQGFRQYEVSNFCRGTAESLHNQAYWKLKDYIGCGAGATGTVYGNPARRWTNCRNIDIYCRFWSRNETGAISDKAIPQEIETLSIDTVKFEFFMLGLRTADGICAEDFAERFGMPIPPHILQTFADWQRKGLMQYTQKGSKHFYSLNSSGLLFLNKLLVEIL